MNAITRRPVTLAISDLILDPDLQPRQQIDRATWEEYLNALADGAIFPPVTVFRDGARYRLADGWHRFHAHQAAHAETINAIVVEGSREDAMRFALGANAVHGKRREPGDYRAAYDRAVKFRLVDATDAGAVQGLLRCTTQWAYKLSEPARVAADVARDAEIAERKAAGQSNRAIARDVGVVEGTVRNVIGAQKINSLTSTHSTEPKPTHPAQLEYNDMTSPRGLAWGALYDALRAINELSAPELLFANRYRRLDAAIGPALTAAVARINDIHRRFFDV